jgi:hypothetical protein
MEWHNKFKDLFARSIKAWQEGRQSASTMFTSEDTAFLSSIGHTPQELFDFVDDYLNYDEPDLSIALEVAAIRYDYFVKELHSKPSSKIGSMAALPAKTDAVDGIAWLPRIIEKARLKLRGEMPPELMYGCAGDRNFLRSVNLSLADFLKLVRDAVDDNRKIIDVVKKGARFNH